MTELTQADRIAARRWIAERRDYLESPGTQRLLAAIGPEDEDLEDDTHSDPPCGAD